MPLAATFARAISSIARVRLGHGRSVALPLDAHAIRSKISHRDRVRLVGNRFQQCPVLSPIIPRNPGLLHSQSLRCAAHFRRAAHIPI